MYARMLRWVGRVDQLAFALHDIHGVGVGLVAGSCGAVRIC